MSARPARGSIWNDQTCSANKLGRTVIPAVHGRYVTNLLEKNDFDLSYAAITAIEQIEDPSVIAVLKDCLTRETDNEILELIDSIVEE